jgi:enoyl-CoA hydratase
LTGDSLTAREAESIGLITECVADIEALDTISNAMIERMVHGAAQAIRLTKSSINAGLKLVANAVMDRAAAFEGITMMTEDHRNALEAFVAKLPATFIGR